MHDANPTDLFSLNCGRCGKSLKIQLEALRDRHTVECPECEKKLPDGVADSQAPLRSPEDVERTSIVPGRDTRRLVRSLSRPHAPSLARQRAERPARLRHHVVVGPVEMHRRTERGIAVLFPGNNTDSLASARTDQPAGNESADDPHCAWPGPAPSCGVTRSGSTTAARSPACSRTFQSARRPHARSTSQTAHHDPWPCSNARSACLPQRPHDELTVNSASVRPKARPA